MGDPIATIRLAPGQPPQTGTFSPDLPTDGPLISCLMVTRGHVFPASFAIRCYQRQSYRDRELVIVCDRPDSAVAMLVARLDDPSIRLIETAPASLGELRNVSVAHARGALLCQWDDDDLYAPDRLAVQAAALKAHDVVAVFLERWLIWWPERRALAASGRRTWEGSMLARREAVPAYPAQALAEDQVTVERLCAIRPVLLIDRPHVYCYVVHGRNSYDEAHFETMMGWASNIAALDRYDADLKALSSDFPFADYEDARAARDSAA
ncbi:glycosyltransferase family 2 protein [Sphingobium boeckii]|uniref:Glycosyltransferase involved in cell wall biosynthesis n=1 Tax=Sphingobium boeckii TaxID=1082345 RepID=A0A7W9AIR9_9SPHN|nr:glycosyltransferase family 2 protein [Sphingobium boeckii]MBB5686232.1 glycosyltransferase involved in cell wall biosynthesis [Sphingobium boeckii]